MPHSDPKARRADPRTAEARLVFEHAGLFRELQRMMAGGEDARAAQPGDSPGHAAALAEALAALDVHWKRQEEADRAEALAQATAALDAARERQGWASAPVVMRYDPRDDHGPVIEGTALRL